MECCVAGSSGTFPYLILPTTFLHAWNGAELETTLWLQSLQPSRSSRTAGREDTWEAQGRPHQLVVFVWGKGTSLAGREGSFQLSAGCSLFPRRAVCPEAWDSGLSPYR